MFYVYLIIACSVLRGLFIIQGLYLKIHAFQMSVCCNKSHSSYLVVSTQHDRKHCVKCDLNVELVLFSIPV